MALLLLRPSPDPVVVDIVIPVYNEETDLEPSVRRLHDYLCERFPFRGRITIVDNASTDRTWAIAHRLAVELDDVDALHLPEKGRGRALRAAWLASDAPIVAYMDVDLSTDLDALLPLVAPLLSGHSEIAIGSRLVPGSRVIRGRKRGFISRSYNVLLRSILRTRFRDAQCGFKAIRADAARRLLPSVEDDAWFFDTELLVLAERAGMRIAEIPVDWVDDPDSRVQIVSTATADLRGIARLLRAQALGSSRTTRQVATFGAIGVVSTLAYVVLYGLLRTSTSAVVANLIALAVTAVGNTAANRRLTFEVHGRDGFMTDQVAGLIAFAVALGITTGAIGLLQLLAPDAGLPVEFAVVVVASGIAAIVRFILLRSWIDRTYTAEARPQAGPEGATR
jgi:putative flippase GtrA